MVGANVVAAFRDQEPPHGRVLRGPVSGEAVVRPWRADRSFWAKAVTRRLARRRVLLWRASLPRVLAFVPARARALARTATPSLRTRLADVTGLGSLRSDGTAVSHTFAAAGLRVVPPDQFVAD